MATVALLGLAVVVGAGRTANDSVESTSASEARLTIVRSTTLAATLPTGRARSAATWCGTPSSLDVKPNVVAGYPVRFLYAIPSDGQDRFSTFANVMQTDWETIDSWWRSQDSSSCASR